jgi:hypothetical protein
LGISLYFQPQKPLHDVAPGGVGADGQPPAGKQLRGQVMRPVEPALEGLLPGKGFSLVGIVVVPVPEPGTGLLVMGGALGLAGVRGRRRF